MEAQAQAQEIWKNATEAQVVIVKHGPNGTTRHELVIGGRTFTLSTDERRMNQNLAYDPVQDIFSNGMLQPVKLPEEASEEVLGNPNHIGDDELPKFFKLHYRTFNKRLDEITNTAVLHRLLNIGPGHDATVRQMEQIQARLDALNPILKKGEPLDDDGLPRIKPVTPR